MRGGKRLGAGRKPAGASIKRNFQDYFTEEEVVALVESVKKDPKLKGFLVEQLFGKAPQRIEMTGKDGEPLVVQISEIIAKKNGIDTKTE